MNDQRDTSTPASRIAIDGDNPEPLLSREWLISNDIGAYASSTVVGCSTRRYHGMLVAATNPPVGRIVTLANVMERFESDTEHYELSTNEFEGTFSPNGVGRLREFRQDAAVTMVWDVAGGTLTRELILHDTANIVALRYTLRGTSGSLYAFPFAALRDFHHLRTMEEPGDMTFQHTDYGVAVSDPRNPEMASLYLAGGSVFRVQPDWWKRFRYRADLRRGQDGHEDLYTPGCFHVQMKDGDVWQLTAGIEENPELKFDAVTRRRAERLTKLADAMETDDEPTRRLAAATDAYVVKRTFADAHTPPSETILAGYHWFADWGRDAFISLPGLLLETGRYEQARNVLRTFASAIHGGMVPNRFDDYAPTAHYNSIDASLWFALAAERYMQATDDGEFWNNTLASALHAIVSAYHDGTQFGIHADEDGLIAGGSPETQLTWMDAKLGDQAVTPRHGKCVEVNALWHSLLRTLAQRSTDSDLAETCGRRAGLVAESFRSKFWHDEMKCLHDSITDGTPDGSLRPNQIIAVSVPFSPLTDPQQRSVVDAVAEHLLTPMGLRTLSSQDPRYRGRYGSSWESRDRAYHQGTVWAWLIGPFIEAYLKVREGDRTALRQAEGWLKAFDQHLDRAGIGHVSEIFDGDSPHEPRGCIAQAWSVAEVLRAKRLVARAQKAAGS